MRAIHDWVDVNYGTVRRSTSTITTAAAASAKAAAFIASSRTTSSSIPRGASNTGSCRRARRPHGSETPMCSMNPCTRRFAETSFRESPARRPSERAYCYVYNNLFHDSAGRVPKEFSYITMITPASEDRQ